MISVAIIDMLNKQYGIEMGAMMFFKTINAWALNNGYEHFADFYHQKSKSEYADAKKYFDYLLSWGAMFMPEMALVRIQPNSIREILKDSLEVEQSVTRALTAIYNQAKTDSDIQTSAWIQKYIKQQTKEETTLIEIITKYNCIVDPNKNYLFDKYIKAFL